MKKIALVFCLMLAVIAGPATAQGTQIDGSTDPEAQSFPAQSKIIVFVATADVALNETFEAEISNGLKKLCDVAAVPSYELFPPTREWDADQVALKLDKAGYAASLYLEYKTGDKDDGQWREFEVKLIDRRSDRTAWLGTATGTVSRQGTARDLAVNMGLDLAKYFTDQTLLLAYPEPEKKKGKEGK